MSASAIVTTFMTALEDQQWEAVSSSLADNFTSSGSVSQPIGKDEWLTISKALANAMPDWSYRFQLLREYGDTVWGILHPSGTHTRLLNLPFANAQPLPPGGKHVELPEERVEFTVHNGQLRAMRVESGPGAGLPGILSQLRGEQPEDAAPTPPPTGPDRLSFLENLPMRDRHAVNG